MNSPKQLFSFIFLAMFLSGQEGLRAEARLQNDQPPKLFVFGDSYVDAGNTDRYLSPAWNEPYGITLPGKPSGRFSDGRVLSDFVAKFLRQNSPVPYELRDERPQDVKYGINFAVGGTGVFDTSNPPNMTVQIDNFQQIIEEKVYYNASDINNSVAYVSVAGNDYLQYIKDHGGILDPVDFGIFIYSVVNQTSTDLIRIHSLGVKKVVVGGLQPLGCLPGITKTYQQCNDTINNLADIHNLLLQEEVDELNQLFQVNSTFLYVDLYGTFTWVLDHPEIYNFRKTLEPCCDGTEDGYVCGMVDKNGEKKYKVCDDPQSYFFWDYFHPTDAGWDAVYNTLQGTNALQPLNTKLLYSS